MKPPLLRAFITLVVVLLFAQKATAGQVEVLWLGHATTKITSVNGKTILIDPATTSLPTAPEKYKNLDNLGNIDLILITHGHGDHVSDLAAIAKKSGAKVVAAYELVLQMVSLGVIEKEQALYMNKGGMVTPLGPGIKIHMVPAEHSSSIKLPNPKPGEITFVDAGNPVGYVIELENGFKIYHSGDTDVFSEMAVIGEMHAPDLAMVCVGGHFTMDGKGAAYALSRFIKPKQVIPIHYATYPMLYGTPEQMKEALGDSPIKVLDVKPGETVKF